MSTKQLINQLKMHSEELYQLWLKSRGDNIPDSNPEVLKQAYEQLCAVLNRSDAVSAKLSHDNLNEIANHGIQLHMESVHWIEQLQAQSIVPDVMKSLILFSAWAGQQQCELDEMEFIVNILGEYTNYVRSPDELEELAQLSSSIIDACPVSLKQNSADNNPGRPWKILLFNNAIIATRSNKDEFIEPAYQLIGQYLPEDAPEFFSQALEQMDVVGYPDNVRILARRYFDLWNNKTQH